MIPTINLAAMTKAELESYALTWRTRCEMLEARLAELSTGNRPQRAAAQGE